MIDVLDVAGESIPHPSETREPELGTGTFNGFQALGYGQDGAPDHERVQHDRVRWLTQLGVTVRPIIRKGLKLLALYDQLRDEHVALGLYDRSIRHEAPVESGETRVYAVGAPKVCLRLGPVHIELRVEAAGEVRLGVGSAGYAGKSVGRVDDAVDAGTLYFVPGGGAALTYSPPGGPPGAGTPIPLTGLKIAAGAPQVKA